MVYSAHAEQFYIGGEWCDPAADAPRLDVVNPATEEPVATIALGTAPDTGRAIAAARTAFSGFSVSTRAERIGLLEAIRSAYKARIPDIAAAISLEMGAPLAFAQSSQALSGLAHIKATLEALKTFEFESPRGTTRIVREPIGVCGLITPWNWPMNQIACKVAPAIATGCTMVLKPSEVAPLSALIFAEIMHEAGVPAGIFNLVNGDGVTVGQTLASHPDIDFVSFTGSTRAGIEVARAAAPTVKRVAQELGGKSANILLPDCDLEEAVTAGVRACFENSGQSCDAPTRMLVDSARHDDALEIARAEAERHVTGDPRDDRTDLGPVSGRRQYEKIQALIGAGIGEGAMLVAGGPGRPDGLNRGFYVRPTVFGNVSNDMTVAREEIFGPVLSILPYANEEEAAAIANDTPYGLAAYIRSADLERARALARRLRAGQVAINGPDWDTSAPFGGYKQSGNGREYADWGMAEFLETKAILGYGAN